jgi:hypothetical protein
MRLLILQLSCRLFFGKTTLTHVCQAPLQHRFGSLQHLAFPKAKIAVEMEGFVNATVTQYTSTVKGVSLPTD